MSATLTANRVMSDVRLYAARPAQPPLRNHRRLAHLRPRLRSRPRLMTVLNATPTLIASRHRIRAKCASVRMDTLATASRASWTMRRRQQQLQPLRQQPTIPAQCVVRTLTANGIEILILGRVLANRDMKETAWYVKRQQLQQLLPLQQQQQLPRQRQLKTHVQCARWTLPANGTEQPTNGLVHATTGM